MDISRKDFLAGAVSSVAILAHSDKGENEQKERGTLPPPPPGTRSLSTLLRKCTACNLCISRCPSNVLRAAGFEYGLEGVMMPLMDFSRGFCRPDCNECSKVCPSGAIQRFDLNDKKGMRQSVAIYVKENCLILKDGLKCGNCVSHCPYQAIGMHKDEDGMFCPVVDSSRCTGCGSCVYHCPSKAIVVVGRVS